MPNGPDQRPSRNRRTRRRSQTSRLPVTEQDEVAELEAARERNDLDVRVLREMTVKELREVGERLEIEASPADRRDDLVDLILQAQTERAGLAYAFGILDIVDEGYGFMRRHGLLPSADDVYVSSSQVRRFGLRVGDRVTGAILARLEKRKVKAERVAFVSIHADSLHPAVRGIMVYVPARSLRPARGPNPASFFACREGAGSKAPRFPPAFRSRSEALSMQLGESVVRSARKAEIAVHPYQPIRSSVLRGGSRWVPAVLRYSRVPTSVLVEIGNLNNKLDREAMQSWRHREKLGHAIAAGLAEGFSR